MKYFADCHFHVMTLKEPNFSSFINSFRTNPHEILSTNATENYLLSAKLLKGDNLLNTIDNALMPFTRPIGETFAMMEDDLLGLFSSPRSHEYAPSIPYLSSGKLRVKDLEYEKMIMCPLLMDFSRGAETQSSVFYPAKAEDKITPYIEDTIEGMRYYYDSRPDGIFEFYPFMGINPEIHSMDFIKNLIEKNINTSHLLHPDHEVPQKAFYGIKVYPPLGFNPWPEDSEALKKTRYIYDFCEENRIPITSHCDDQGFRGINGNLAWSYSDPANWRTVLENYPDLVINFAHFGKQYAISANLDIKVIQARLKRRRVSPWTETILSLMRDFNGVYADISFSGCSPDFYESLQGLLEASEIRNKLLPRILFGSDYSINLLKLESYTEYFSLFNNSAFSSEEADAIVSSNPMRFLGLSEPAPVLSWSQGIRTLKKPRKVR